MRNSRLRDEFKTLFPDGVSESLTTQQALFFYDNGEAAVYAALYEGITLNRTRSQAIDLLYDTQTGPFAMYQRL
jgi:hypothetical protein